MIFTNKNSITIYFEAHMKINKLDLTLLKMKHESELERDESFRLPPEFYSFHQEYIVLFH